MNEIHRLTEVYNEYRHDPSVQRRWSISNVGNQAIVSERTRLLFNMLRTANRLPLDQQRILDVGCGAGGVLASLSMWQPRPDYLFGIDLLADRVAMARQRFPELFFQRANAEHIPFVDDAFDIVLLFTVFTSIKDETMAQHIATEVRRVLRTGGVIIWYDFRYNNPRNSHVHGIHRSTITRLFPGFDYELQTLTVMPPVARRLGPATRMLYPILARISPLRTHYLGLLHKRCE